MICIWHPFECDMSLDGTLTCHIDRVADEFDMACQSAIQTNIAREWMPYAFSRTKYTSI